MRPTEDTTLANPRSLHRRRTDAGPPRAGTRLLRAGAAALALHAAGACAGDAALEAGRFLVASRGMADPRFAHTVVLVVEHGPGGALGLVVNRATAATLGRALPDMESRARAGDPLWYGGPVAPGRAAVLVAGRGAPQPSRQVLQDLQFSTDPAVLAAVLGDGDARFRVYAGYAGWAPGQLEGELARGDWTVSPATTEQVFRDDGMQLWRELAGERGTWVRRGRGPEPASVVLARHLERGQRAVGVHVHGDEHRAAAHAAVFHVPGVAGRAVHRELDRLPAERAGG